MLQEFVTKYAWEGVWSRPGLDLKTRRLITLALLAGHRHHHELLTHLRAARKDGVTVQEIQEVFLHSAIYVGIPASRQAFEVLAKEVDGDEARD